MNKFLTTVASELILANIFGSISSYKISPKLKWRCKETTKQLITTIFLLYQKPTIKNIH